MQQGGDGGGEVPPGAALALKGSGRLPVGICGDGDFLMSATALWTAVHYRIPLLIVVANNRSFYNDEVHQERMAILRNRPVDNKWIGQKMLDPEIDLAGMARAQGARGFGPVVGHDQLETALAQAIAAVEDGEVAVIDVRIEPGYGARDAGAVSQRAGRQCPQRLEIVGVATRDDDDVGVRREVGSCEPGRDVLGHDLGRGGEALAVCELLAIVDHVDVKADFLREQREMGANVPGADDVQLG